MDGLKTEGEEVKRQASDRDGGKWEKCVDTHLNTPTRSEGVLRKYDANNENAGSFILKPAANN